MTILPAVTGPWSERIERRHTPKPAMRNGGYEDYRPCLRWEFDFYCAFCLCHESDLRVGASEGSKGSGIFSIEHFILKSQEPELANVYENCLYACRYCNRHRGRQPHLGGAGQRLLNLCDTVWSEHFVRDGDELKPRDGQTDTQYTHEVYKLDSPIKRRARKLRREKIVEYQKAVNDYPPIIKALRDKGFKDDDRNLIQAAAMLSETRRYALEDTRTHFSLVPRDAQMPCPCGLPLPPP